MSLPCALNRKNSMEAYDKAERRVLRRAAREHVDVPAPARDRILDHAYAPLGLVRVQVAHLEPLPVAVGEDRPEVALVLDAAGEDRRARARLCAGLLLALGDDDLVLDVVVDHVHLELLPSAAWVFRAGREDEHDAWFFAGCGRRVGVHAYRGEVDALIVNRGPLLHQVSRDLVVVHVNNADDREGQSEVT